MKDGLITTRECECMNYRRSISRLRKSGLKSVIDEYSFDKYIADDPWQKNAKAMAIDYVSDNTGKWFCALGAVGSGKTHLCTAICSEFLKAGKDVRYMLWRDESVKIKAATTDSYVYSELLTPYKQASVLYIDDLFKTEHNMSPTPADTLLAFELLNTRYANKDLITIISSERSMSDLLNIDEAVGSRIYQRSKGYCIEIRGNDKNMRLK